MLNKETLENLSKYNYVYRAYISDGVIHFEQFPIVYANQNYIYYKQGRKDQLGVISVNGYYSCDKTYDNSNDLFHTIYNSYELYPYVY